MIRFHLDEHGSHALADGLRRLGLEVTMTFEVGLLHASDEQQLEFARAHERVIFTHDDDFLRLHAAGTPHAGIAYCDQGSRTLGEMIEGLALIAEVYSADEMRNRVEFL